MKKLTQSWKYIALAAGLGLLTIMVIGFNSRMAELRRLSAQSEQVSAQFQVLEQTQMVLDAEIAYATSDVAVREWAYEDAHMVQDGDYPIVPVPSVKNTPVSPVEMETSQTEVRNWQVWLALFFD
jgi:cell division protein FtsB